MTQKFLENFCGDQVYQNKKGMTLVLDMKLHRLERVACCTGSPILSCDNLNGQKLRHCDFIYFEKFVRNIMLLVKDKRRPSRL